MEGEVKGGRVTGRVTSQTLRLLPQDKKGKKKKENKIQNQKKEEGGRGLSIDLEAAGPSENIMPPGVDQTNVLSNLHNDLLND